MKYLVVSNTASRRTATVTAPNEQAAILKAYGIWDRRAMDAGQEPPVSWGVQSITPVPESPKP